MEQNQNDAAYLSMLTRNIPGVGNTPLSSNASKRSSTSDPLTNRDKNNLNSNDLTEKQRQATKTLDSALSDALFVSEGEEPFQIVHIIPTESSLQSNVSASSSSLPLPTDRELLKILKSARLLPEDDDVDDINCERSFDLQPILDSSTSPGADKIAKALKDVFQQDPSSISSQLPAMALYRVTLPSSQTRVHLWVLGWVDQHLLGYHTVSIES
ncbi:hypothetical protein BGX28_000530 [Mortierella sp. GBA30]|nr:hypothetical protein BGX28_000530 [Mortierella sp. GBA30]